VRVELDVPHATLLAADDGEVLSDRAERTVRALVEHEPIDATWSRYETGEAGPDPHIHLHHVDAFFIVEGELEFGVGPDVEWVRAPAGTFVLVPPNVVHTFRNASGATARWLNFHAPSTGFVKHLRGDPSFDSDDPPADGGRPAADAIVCAPGAGEVFTRDNRTLTLLGDEPRLSALEIAFDETFSVEPHRHDDQVDSFFVLDGAVEFTLEDRVVVAQRGMWMSAPPGALHGFGNAGPGEARVLNIHAPDAGFADGVRSF
jgi:quercetin dioxygenase-like cupin family protein